MQSGIERRRERRLHCHWPIWFSTDDFNKTLLPAEMIDISSGGMGFTYENTPECPKVGQKIELHFSVPRFQPDGSYDRVSFTRIGIVLAVRDRNDSLCRVSLQFTSPLSFKPGEDVNIQKVMQSNSASL